MEIKLNLTSKMLMGNLIRHVCVSTYLTYVETYPTSMIINLFLSANSIRRYAYFEDIEPWQQKSEYLLRMLDIDCDIKINHYLHEIKSNKSKKAMSKVCKKTLKKVTDKLFDGVFVKFKN